MVYHVAVGLPLAAGQLLEAHPITGHTQLFGAVPDAVRQKFSPALDAGLLGARFQTTQLNQQRCWNVSLPRTGFLRRRAE